MSNSELKWDPNEQINLRYRLFARAIRINGSAQISTLEGYLQLRLAKTFECLVEPQLNDESMYSYRAQGASYLIMCSDWSRIKIAPIMRDLATGMLGVYHFGDRLSRSPSNGHRTILKQQSGSEPKFASAMSQYYQDTVACMGAFQVLPTILHPWTFPQILLLRQCTNS